MSQMIKCEISPSLRVSRKLKCIDEALNLLTIDEANEVLSYARTLNLDSELDVDSLISFISDKFNVKFIFE
jgi:hypothetical protein